MHRSAGLAWAAPGPATAQPALLASGIERSGMALAVRPRNDLFRHANGRWLKTTSIPADRATIGGLAAIHERTQGRLRALVGQAAAGRGNDADAARIDDLHETDA